MANTRKRIDSSSTVPASGGAAGEIPIVDTPTPETVDVQGSAVLGSMSRLKLEVAELKRRVALLEAQFE